MKKYTAILLLMIGVVGELAAQELTVSLKLRSDEAKKASVIEFEETFEVEIRNDSRQPVRLPDSQKLESMAVISFRFQEQESGKTFEVTQQSASNRENESSRTQLVDLQPGESISLYPGFSFDIWGPRKWRNLPTPNSGRNLLASVKLDTSGCDLDIWRGQVESESMPIRFVFQRARQPHQYLWYGFADAALEQLKANPRLVNERDEDQRTPLHVASRFRHKEVVKWLIDHDADVNLKAYNRFTPLYFAIGDVEICQMLLKAGADPNAENAFGKSPLQELTAKLAEPRTKNQPKLLQNYQDVLTVFLENGVQLDLISAIQLGRTQAVMRLLENQPELLDKFVPTQEPLRTAAKHGRLDIVEFFLESFPEKMDVDNFSGGTGFPVTKEALGHAEILKVLLDSGADLERRITWQGGRTGIWLIGDNATLLHYAARDGTPESMKLLLDSGLNPFAYARADFSDTKEQTALDVACLFGNAELAEVILTSEQFRNGPERRKKETLNRCVVTVCGGGFGDRSGFPKLLEMLLANGAKVDSDSNISLIQSVTHRIHPNDQRIETDLRPMVDVLLAAGVEMDLFSAVALRDQDEIDRLLASNPELSEARRSDGYPAIHFAASCGEIEIVKKLLAAGCDLDLKNHSKTSGYFAERLIHVAAFWNQVEIAKLLVESGAKVNVIAKEKVTPLHVAAYAGNLEMVEYLLRQGANVHAEDINGRTPLTRATHPAIRKLLQEWAEKQ